MQFQTVEFLAIMYRELEKENPEWRLITECFEREVLLIYAYPHRFAKPQKPVWDTQSLEFIWNFFVIEEIILSGQFLSENELINSAIYVCRGGRYDKNLLSRYE